MAITECGRGHVYDSDQYATCPYCNQGAGVIDFGVNDPYYQQPAPGMGYDPGFGYAPVDDYGHTVAPGQMGGIGSMGGMNPEDEGKTVSPFESKRREDEENKTVVVFQKEHDYDPVVGWLVCIEGVEKGKDHRIMARINTVGRSEKMDICIPKDNTVSKENHARIAYDPKNNMFLVVPDKNINNIYVNGQPIFSATKLTAYDVIELGSGKFVFVPLCGDRFEWEIGVKTAEQ